MAASLRYLGAPTPFGVITHVENRLYNPRATCTDKTGIDTVRQLPHLIAMGVQPFAVWQDAGMSHDPNKMYSGVSDSERMFDKEQDGTISVHRRAARESPYKWEFVERGSKEFIRDSYNLPKDWVDQ